MSKYEPLWKYVQSEGKEEMKLSFATIKDLLGFPIDHSFLNYKKELLEYGYQVGKISIKAQTVNFMKVSK